MRRLRRVVGDLVDTLTFEAWTDSADPPDHKVVHRYRPGSSCWARETRERRWMRVTDLQPKKTCETCLRAYAVSDVAGRSSDFLTALLNLIKETDTATKADTSDSRKVVKRRDALRKAITSVHRHRFTVNLTHADVERLDAEIRESGEQLRSLEHILSGGQDEAFAMIRSTWFGSDRPGAIVDDNRTLVGLHPFDKSGWVRLVEVLVEQCAVITQPLVIAVPRYVADWIVMQPASHRNGLHPTAGAAGLTDAQLQTAAKLWEPDGTGALSTLAGAVAAARLI